MKKLVVLLLIAVSVVACKKNAAEEGAAPVAKEASKEVHVYNWSEYLPEEVLTQFEEETGIKVIYTVYDSNEAMYAKVKLLDGKGYDVIVPSTYYITKMADEGLLHKIDRNLITNFDQFTQELLFQPFDKNNDYSIPYMWGTTGMAVNTDYIDPSKVKSWADLWNPEFKGQLMLQNDVREVFHAALRKLGYSGNTRDEAEIKAAYDELVKLMPSVRLFNSDSPKIPYLNEEVYVGMMWNGEGFRANNENPKIQYVYPTEGVAAWMDSFAIPANAQNVENAHKFIDFMSRPDVSAQVSNFTGYSSPVATATEFLDEAAKNSRIAYPTSEELKNMEFQLSVGDAITIYDKYWQMLRAGN